MSNHYRPVIAGATSALVAMGLVASALFAPAASAATSTDDSGYITLTMNDKVMTSGCRNYVFSYSVSVLSGQGWSLDVDATGVNGGSSSDFEYGTGSRSSTGSFFLCGSVDGPGKYTYEATLDVDTAYDEDFNEIDPGGVFQTRTVAYLQVRTHTTMKVTHKAFRCATARKSCPHVYKVKGANTFFSGTYAFKDGSWKSMLVQFKKKGSSKYRTIMRVSINDSTRYYTAKVKLAKPGRIRVKALEGASGLGSVSKSKAVR